MFDSQASPRIPDSAFAGCGCGDVAFRMTMRPERLRRLQALRIVTELRNKDICVEVCDGSICLVGLPQFTHRSVLSRMEVNQIAGVYAELVELMGL